MELPKSVNAPTLYRKALVGKISIAPGPLFSAKQGYPNFIQLSCEHT